MNVYEIHEVWIAAKKADHALGQFLEEKGDDLAVGSLEEGEEETIEIRIRRLTEKEIGAKSMNCCPAWGDGCELCKEAGDFVRISLQDLIDKRKPEDFPCVIAEEE